jgi:hypothetical protein
VGGHSDVCRVARLPESVARLGSGPGREALSGVPVSRIGECDFCWRNAAMILTSYRHSWWRQKLGLPRKTSRVCQRCAPRAIRWLNGR